MRNLLALALALFALSASAATVTVGCPGGSPGTYASIAAALAAVDTQGPNTISVSGTCSESVVIDQRERLTIQGPATITGTANFGISIRHSGAVTLRNLSVSASRTGISVENGSFATIAGVTAEAPLGNALDVFGGSSVNVGGANAVDQVTLHNSNVGLRMEGSVAFASGWLTVENNGTAGIQLDSGRLEIFGQQTSPLQGGPAVIRNNFTGISIQNGGFVQLARYNLIQNNTSNGAILTAGAILHLAGTANGATIIEGNPRSGVAVLFNSTFRSNGPNLIRNNGSATDQFRSGISLSHNSMAWIGTGTQITGTIGRGILADSGASVRLDNTTIDGSTEHGIVLIHGAILESIAGNTVTPNGSGSVSCDATTVVFGEFAGVAPFECAKKDKEK